MLGRHKLSLGRELSHFTLCFYCGGYKLTKNNIIFCLTYNNVRAFCVIVCSVYLLYYIYTTAITCKPIGDYIA